MNNNIVNYSKYFLYLSFCLCLLFLTSSHFVDKEVLPKWYAFYGFTLILVLNCTLYKQTLDFKIDAITIALFLFVLYLLIGCSFQHAHGMSIVFQLIGFLLLFLFFKLTSTSNVRIIPLIIIGCCTLQAIWGILQFAGLINSNSSFAVVGSFDNPAGFAACLSAGFLFGFDLLSNKRIFWKFISVAAMVIILTGIILSGSRAGMISVVIVSLLYLFRKFSPDFTKRTKVCIVIIAFIGITILSTACI